jgi:GNAT superfamily N-acetyltransferase
MEIRALREGDARAEFRSGDGDLDRFLQKFAGQNQFKHYVGVTYVAVDKGRILGFATVAAGHVEIDQMPVATRKALPRYPLPVLRLGRLAVDLSAQGLGLGQALLRFVLRLSVRMAEDYGCVGVLVDAKPDAVDFYAKYGFVPVELIEGQSEARPHATAMFRSIRAIRVALGAEGDQGG